MPRKRLIEPVADSLFGSITVVVTMDRDHKHFRFDPHLRPSNFEAAKNKWWSRYFEVERLALSSGLVDKVEFTVRVRV